MRRYADLPYFDHVQQVHDLDPSKFVFATEACNCPGVKLDDWQRGGNYLFLFPFVERFLVYNNVLCAARSRTVVVVYLCVCVLTELYGFDIIGDLEAWSIGWVDWNLLLNTEGGPNHVGNYCDAGIIAGTRFSSLYLLLSVEFCNLLDFLRCCSVCHLILPCACSYHVSPPLFKQQKTRHRCRYHSRAAQLLLHGSLQSLPGTRRAARRTAHYAALHSVLTPANEIVVTVQNMGESAQFPDWWTAREP